MLFKILAVDPQMMKLLFTTRVFVDKAYFIGTFKLVEISNSQNYMRNQRSQISNFQSTNLIFRPHALQDIRSHFSKDETSI